MPEPLDPIPSLEMWGGIECTLNRVGDRFFDQLELNGHGHQIEDLDRFADLGIAAIRYPVLWERTAPNGLVDADWTWSDARLERLRELGVRPIVGLVHHGNGPIDTDLLDPSFPEKLARYAGAVAARYPWLTDYTPVNEPLTTARFGALYGHWYPHHRDEGAFLRAALTQCRGVVAAMRAIRAVNPAARLVQTEDLGEVFARPAVADQAAFENERRWLSLDLLTGRVVPGHYFWERLLAMGVSESDLIGLADDPCPPDVIGVNHYLTSERLLDERIDRYPAETHGGNWQHAYADIEAVRVCVDGPGGWDRLLRATWDRYGLPVAATEVHLACTREEQLRWLLEVWDTARALRREGIDIRAVTAWSLLGAFGWNRLVTQEGGDYEPGVFDLRAPNPRPTALAKLIKELATGMVPTHPVLTVPGWWRRPSRLQYPPVDRWGTDVVASIETEVPSDAAGILVIGPAAPLRETFAASCAMRAIPCICRENSLPGSWESDIRLELAAGRPWAVAVTSLADVAVDDVEAMSRACAEVGVPLLSCESGRILPGTTMVPAVRSELGPIGPVTGPNQATRDVEQALLAIHPGAMVVLGGTRVAPESWAGSAPETRRGRVGERGEGDLIGDARALADTSIDLLIDGAAGVWHLATRLALAGDRLAFIEPDDPVARSERKVG